MLSKNTAILARKILLVFILFIIGLGIIGLILRNAVQIRQDRLTRLSNHFKTYSDKPERALSMFHHAEMDFQASLWSVKKNNSLPFKTETERAIALFEEFVKEDKLENSLKTIDPKTLTLWNHQKINLSQRILSLKHSFDSLLFKYSDFQKVSGLSVYRVDTLAHTHKKTVDTTADTIHNQISKPKKGFFSRLKTAFSGKGDTINSTLIEKVKKEKELDAVTQRIESRDNHLWLIKIKGLQSRNIRVLQAQRDLILLNHQISSEFENMIGEVKEIDQNIGFQVKDLLFKNYQETSHTLNLYGLISMMVVIIAGILLFVFILQLNKTEKRLKRESDRSLVMAQQKTDLLLYMSHEIRNPLSSIYGFLNVFGQTSLSSKQKEMLDSIKLSSDMLLSTLNDTLDTAKMENANFRIHKEPYHPNYIFNLVKESMEFSALKKQLELKFTFIGDPDLLILGDAFRLKQVAINLLSNAIKNTEKGGVYLKVECNHTDKKIYVEVMDTGMGIAPDQIHKLFSKYYQAPSSKNQLGTGLGLYLCKRLVELQGGKISAKSQLDKGSQFSFYIPFEIATEALLPVHKPENPSFILNGHKILAVDDNEVNLRLLKMMASKWNIKYQSASSGAEALEILSHERIDIVVTDLLMPEMDGNDLLTNIRKLDSENRLVPVILISGMDKNKNNPEAHGFSAILLKPFKEIELINAITLSLQSEEAPSIH